MGILGWFRNSFSKRDSFLICTRPIQRVVISLCFIYLARDIFFNCVHSFLLSFMFRSSEVNQSAKECSEKPEISEKSEAVADYKRAHPCSRHSCGSISKSRKCSDDPSVHGSSHHHSITRWNMLRFLYHNDIGVFPFIKRRAQILNNSCNFRMPQLCHYWRMTVERLYNESFEYLYSLQWGKTIC